MADEDCDVVIIGAGVSGIGMACRLTRECPDVTYRILERRDSLGGTWDLFRYPGVRSDSDMYTFGYDFRPWRETRVLADGATILRYLHDTAGEYGVGDHIRFGRSVTSAKWSTAAGCWTIESVDTRTGERHVDTANVLVSCTGYYDYDVPYRPDFAGEERFSGPIVHPQQWPADLDYDGKRVLVVGSGATAVTLVPALAESAAHVTMLQRSPGYVVSLPADDRLAALLGKVLADSVVYRLARARNIAVQRGTYALSRARPRLVRRLVARGVRRHLGTSDIEDFEPSYDPWDQRMCIVPDADLFRAIRGGRAEVVTDAIDTFTSTGVRLRSGREISADLVVIATGLTMQMLGGAALVVDGAPIVLRDQVTYKAVLIEDVPNAAAIFGYTNSSWTLKADLAAAYLCRLLRHMREHGYSQFVARASTADHDTGSVFGSLDAGYVRRGDAVMPRQGTHGAWRVSNNYYRDKKMLCREPIDDGILQFTRTDTVGPCSTT